MKNHYFLFLHVLLFADFLFGVESNSTLEKGAEILCAGDIVYSKGLLLPFSIMRIPHEEQSLFFLCFPQSGYKVPVIRYCCKTGGVNIEAFQCSGATVSFLKAKEDDFAHPEFFDWNLAKKLPVKNLILSDKQDFR